MTTTLTHNTCDDMYAGENREAVYNTIMAHTSAAHLTQPDAADLYNRLAVVYDLWAWLTESKARARALQLADVKDGESVLEVAVGTGLAFTEIVGANPHGRNVGIDISEGMLRKAELRLAGDYLVNFDLSVGSAFDIPEADNSFDLIMNSYMFDLLPEDDWPGVLAEFHRVLRPGGRLVLSGMTPGERRGSTIYHRIFKLSPWLGGGCQSALMTGPIEKAGFDVVSRDYVQQMLFPSEIICARKP